MLPDLSYFSFEELWSPFFFFGVALAAIGYLYWIGPWREKHLPDEPAVPASRRLLALTGFALFYLAQGGPLELLAHLNFMYHMITMSLSYLIVPPLILLGTPAFVWRKLFGAAFWRRFRWITKPILTLLLFNGLFSFYHVPAIHDFVMTNYAVHAIYYAALFIAAFLMWWHVVSPVPEWNRLTDLRKMGYIFANGLLLTPACALIIFAGEPLYRVYTDPSIWVDAMGYCIGGNAQALLELVDGPFAFTVLGPFEDQQSGGIIMKLVQEVMYGSILAYVFSQWFRKEREAEEDTSAAPAGNTGNNA